MQDCTHTNQFWGQLELEILVKSLETLKSQQVRPAQQHITPYIRDTRISKTLDIRIGNDILVFYVDIGICRYCRQNRIQYRLKAFDIVARMLGSTRRSGYPPDSSRRRRSQQVEDSPPPPARAWGLAMPPRPDGARSR